MIFIDSDNNDSFNYHILILPDLDGPSLSESDFEGLGISPIHND